ncbi:hypothetical protein ACFL6E_03210 [Candidatus Neomarinimicrobiota bacterium]
MSLKNLFLLKAILSLIFGLSFIFFSALSMDFFGVMEMRAAGVLMGRLLGGALVGMAVIAWYAQSLGAGEGRTAIVNGFIVTDALGFIITLMAVLENVINDMGWISVIVYLLLALGFIYFQYFKASD